jgi:hypothetical protein
MNFSKAPALMYLHVACEIALALSFYMAEAPEANDGSDDSEARNIAQ